MKKVFTIIGLLGIGFFTMAVSACDDKGVCSNRTAFDEQIQTENNQAHLFQSQPPPRLSWSLERDNLIKRFKLQNDRALTFFMYVFIEGVAQPIGYYQVNKISSVDSQLTSTSQVVQIYGNYEVIPSPAEDGSYGTNGNGVFGFTPEDIYIEHNMKYLVSTIPLTFATPVTRLAIVNTKEAEQLLQKSKEVMAK